MMIQEGGNRQEAVGDTREAARWYGCLQTERNRVAISCASCRLVDHFLDDL